MPTFTCRIGTASGSVITQQREAESASSLKRELEEKGYYVFEIHTKKAFSLWPLAFSTPIRRIKQKDLLIFNEELLALVRAGLPIMASLDLLVDRTTNPRLKAILDQVRGDVKGGLAFSDAAERHPHVFSRLYTASLRAGEKAGNFSEVLRRYIDYMRRILALRKKVLSALFYPSVLVIITGAVITFLLTFVVPTFSRIYSEFEATLPFPTQVLIAVTRFLKGNLPILALALVLVSLALWQWRQTETGRRWMDRLVLRLPWFGDVATKYSLSMFARTLATVTGGGIPIVPALEVASGSVQNTSIGNLIKGIIPRVEAGEGLASALGMSRIVPPMALEMIAVGESTGSLEEMLNHVADFYDSEVDTRLSSMASLIEPIIMLSMGLIVATIVITMYLPIFHLASVVR
ncbi:MAG: type II secretion system F family protein [candidate division NC10 bacterium]|nr:type II secretion system F family protein [candidate division NC10 bacterium]